MTSTRSANTANLAPLVPPELGLANLRIHGFASLKPGEKLQAAALALHRDLSIEPTNLRIAVQAAPESPDNALIAFCTVPDTAASKSAGGLATQLLAAMRPGYVYWVDAPCGYIVGDRGAAAVEIAATAHALPAAVAGTLAAIGAAGDARCILVNRDRAAATDEHVAWWAAASGVAMEDGDLPASTPQPLVAPPRTSVALQKTPFDRALIAGAVAGLLCVSLAVVQYAAMPRSTTASTSVSAGTLAEIKSSHASAGALLDRIGTITPDIALQTQTATYASGAWVLALPDAFPADAMKRAGAALRANGLAVQTTSAPGPRLRVQLP